MQRSEENVGATNAATTLKSAPNPKHQSGNVNVFVLATAMVISAMWLVFQHDAEGTPTIPAAQASIATSSQSVLDTISERERNSIVEVVVTAPRLTETSENFEQPATEVALVAPKAPKTFWQSPS